MNNAPVYTQRYPRLKVNVREYLADASKRYHKLVLIVGLPYTGKTKLLQAFNEEPDTIYVNLGLELSEKLLNHSSLDQGNVLVQAMDEVVEPYTGVTLLFDNIELLFDVNLNVNVLDIFKNLSRYQTCVVTWTGKVTGNRIRFSEPGHWGDNRSYDIKDTVVIDLNGVRDEV